MSNEALILVDIQNDYFPGGTMELINMEAAAAKAAAFLERCRREDRPIFHIQHLAASPTATFFLPDTAGAEHHQLVKPAVDETVVKKHYPSAFRETDLLERLRDNNITQLTIVGAMSHMCIDATTRAAFDLGFQCTVIEDACATRDLEFNGKKIAAAEVHGSFMAALSSPYANVINLEQAL